MKCWRRVRRNRARMVEKLSPASWRESLADIGTQVSEVFRSKLSLLQSDLKIRSDSGMLC
jgi:hypothetical protein